jgi:hypothetical protein
VPIQQETRKRQKVGSVLKKNKTGIKLYIMNTQDSLCSKGEKIIGTLTRQVKV